MKKTKSTAELPTLNYEYIDMLGKMTIGMTLLAGMLALLCTDVDKRITLLIALPGCSTGVAAVYLGYIYVFRFIIKHHRRLNHNLTSSTH